MSSWSIERAEEHLLGLELFGMRFGLDRMRKLLLALGSPQERFESIHVVGTNGKSSTVRMTAAALQATGRRAGAYLSPHLVGFEERIRIDGQDIAPEDFARAIGRAVAAAQKVDRNTPADDRVTQFELLTAAAYDELARREAGVVVVEAGLGGRWDATNVIPSAVQVLTNVGLEHTRWLGPTVRDIAREKLAVVRPGATLVVGPDLHPDALEESRAVVRDREARLVEVEAKATRGFQRLNLATALAAAEAFAGPLPEEARAVAASVDVPGRMQVVDVDPVTVLDGAHNPAGAEALASAVRMEVVERPLAVVLSVLDDKDAPGILRPLLDLADLAVLTRSANPRALSPSTLQSLGRQLTGVEHPVVAEPNGALARARELVGPGGAVVATGSIYLVADLLRAPGARAVSML